MNKKILISFLIVAVLVSFAIFVVIFYQKNRGKIPSKKEEILPQGQLQQEQERSVEELLKELTPTTSKPMSEKEKNELESLLKELTPTQPKPMSEKEEKELEELLKNLTPQ